MDNEKWSDEECWENFKNEVSKQPHKKQAVFFLNAWWKEEFKDAEEMDNTARKKEWINTEKLLKKNKLDLSDLKDKKNAVADETRLDEMPGSHRLLELMGVPLTVIQFRKEFKKIDQNHDQKMSMIEYLVYKYNKKTPNEYICEMMRKPQGTNKALILAEEQLEKVQEEIAKIERKKAELEEKSKKQGVKGRLAQQELNILLASDPLPLRKALIEAEAAVRKAKKSENLNCQGKMWFVERELGEAKLYKPGGL